VSNSARQKLNIMESKILIDINYASREPQIVIHVKESDDPRDKLISMFTGQAMPGVRDGYCRIERYPNQDMVVITPVHPVDLIKHIPTIAKFAEENAASDTSSVPDKLREIIAGEYDRLGGTTDTATLKKADDWAQLNLPHDLYKKWHQDMFGYPPSKPPKAVQWQQPAGDLKP
jgi:hypothetical protein